MALSSVNLTPLPEYGIQLWDLPPFCPQQKGQSSCPRYGILTEKIKSEAQLLCKKY